MTLKDLQNFGKKINHFYQMNCDRIFEFIRLFMAVPFKQLGIIPPHLTQLCNIYTHCQHTLKGCSKHTCQAAHNCTLKYIKQAIKQVF